MCGLSKMASAYIRNHKETICVGHGKVKQWQNGTAEINTELSYIVISPRQLSTGLKYDEVRFNIFFPYNLIICEEQLLVLPEGTLS